MATTPFIGAYSLTYGPYAAAPAQPLTAPVLAQPTATSSTVTNTWTGPNGPQTLERAPVTNGTVGTFAAVSPGPGTAKNYQDAGLTFNTRYAYRVFVTVNGVASPYSNVVQVTTASNGSPVITPGTTTPTPAITVFTTTAY